MMLRTRLPANLLIALVVFALASQSFVASVLVVLAYGLTKGLGVVTAVLASGSQFAEACTVIRGRQIVLLQSAGAAALSVGVFLLSTGLGHISYAVRWIV